MAYGHKLIGNSSLRLQKSRDELAYDFSMETIRKHLEKPDKFEPSRNPDLVKYLKYNILRQLTNNFKEKKAQELEIGYEPEDSTGLKVAKSFVEENDIHDLIDRQNVLRYLQLELNDNPKLLELFNLRYSEEYTRKEICKSLDISTREYANRIRRLDTVVNRVLKKQEYE
jgi:DNA-directed RNA polymerase specialized sigma subunit